MTIIVGNTTYCYITPSSVSDGNGLCGLVVWVPGYISRQPRLDSRRYQVLWEIVSLERGPVSLVSTIEEQLERKSSRSGLENRKYDRKDPSLWPRGTLYPQKICTNFAQQATVARPVYFFSRTQATELVCQMFADISEQCSISSFSDGKIYNCVSKDANSEIWGSHGCPNVTPYQPRRNLLVSNDRNIPSSG
jgi:hypothetical protein